MTGCTFLSATEWWAAMPPSVDAWIGVTVGVLLIGVGIGVMVTRR